MSLIKIIKQSSNQDKLYDLIINKFSLLDTKRKDNHIKLLLLILKTIPILANNKMDLRKLFILLMNLEENIPASIYLRKSVASYIKNSYKTANDSYFNRAESYLSSFDNLTLFQTNNENFESIDKKRINFISNTAIITLIQSML